MVHLFFLKVKLQSSFPESCWIFFQPKGIVLPMTG